jgi:hypothetical protein
VGTAIWDAGVVPGQAASLIAHQGGWDEILFVLAPIALFAGLLVLANKRAAAALAEQDAEGPDHAGGADGPGHDDGTENGSGAHRGTDGTGHARDGHGVGAAPEERRGPGRPTG